MKPGDIVEIHHHVSLSKHTLIGYGIALSEESDDEGWNVLDEVGAVVRVPRHKLKVLKDRGYLK